VLIDFLRVNGNMFAWGPSDMPGILRDVTEHSLNIRTGSKLVKQWLRRFDEEKHRAIDEEI
jgi:prophage maintenance system killer protein